MAHLTPKTVPSRDTVLIALSGLIRTAPAPADLLTMLDGGIHCNVKLRRRLHGLAVPNTVLAGVLALGGCPPPPDPRLTELQKKADLLSTEKDSLSRKVQEQQTAIDVYERRVATLQKLPEKPFLFTVDRIELDRLTGGADYDGKPGDDGVNVYLRPLDASGDVLKAAGEIQVQLLDLTESGKPVEIGLYVVNEAERLQKNWYGKLWTGYYLVQCPWQPGAGPPPGGEVLIRATFLDWLTGKVHVATKTAHIKPPPK